MSTTPPTQPGTDNPPQGREAVNAATSKDSAAVVKHNALAYFMGEAPAPGTGEEFPLWLDMDGPEKVEYRFRTLDVEEIDAANDEGRKAREQGKGQVGASFVVGSVLFAYACIEPNLAAALEHRRQTETDRAVKDRLVDTAALVREVFRKRAGVLDEAAAAIDAKSKIGRTGSVDTEIEAGKGSR